MQSIENRTLLCFPFEGWIETKVWKARNEKKNSMDEIDFEAFLNLRHKRNITDKFTF